MAIAEPTTFGHTLAEAEAADEEARRRWEAEHHYEILLAASDQLLRDLEQLNLEDRENVPLELHARMEHLWRQVGAERAIPHPVGWKPAGYHAPHDVQRAVDWTLDVLQDALMAIRRGKEPPEGEGKEG